MDSKGLTTSQQVPSTDGAPSPAGGLTGFLPIILICVLFYFLIMRPQQKKEAAKREKLNQLKKGDCVVTNGGVVGKIDKIVNDAEVTVEISNGVIVRMYKNFIAEILDKSLLLDLEHEGDNWNIVPNNSTTIYLILLQGLALQLADKLGITLQDFKKNHPGGAIGDILKNA